MFGVGGPEKQVARLPLNEGSGIEKKSYTCARFTVGPQHCLLNITAS